MNKQKKKGIFYYLNPRHLSDEVASMNMKVDWKKAILAYVLFVCAMIGAGYGFRLDFLPYTISLIVVGFVLFPYLTYLFYKQQYEEIRFGDVNNYIERTLYNFKANPIIADTLKKTATTFQPGPMKNLIELASKAVITDGDKAALEYIEMEYDNTYIKQMHRLMLSVASKGGDYSESADLLLQFRREWMERTTSFQRQKKKRRISSIMAIGISLLICIVMERLLIYATANPNGISKLPLVEIVTCITIIGDFFIYLTVQKLAAGSWLQSTTTNSDKKIKETYYKATHFDKKKAIRDAAIMEVLPLAIAIGGYLLNIRIMYAIAGIMAIYVAFNPFLQQSKRKKLLHSELNVAFPRWLMNIALLSQSNSVRVSLQKSVEEAPVVMLPELIKLNNALNENPGSKEPYYDFLKDFHMSYVSSAMQMLEAIDTGTGVNTKKQINELIAFNGTLLDKAEREANDNVLAGFLILDWAPSGVASFKMVVDMVVFMLVFMGSFGTLMNV